MPGSPTKEKFNPAVNSPTVQATSQEELARRLERYRLANDLSFKKLALVVRVNWATLYHLVRGDYGHRLTARIAFKIERFLESVRA